MQDMEMHALGLDRRVSAGFLTARKVIAYR